MRINAILASTIDGVIGENSRIPWKVKGEQTMFKHITMGHTVVMGRKTFDSLGKPLPGRKNVVLTRSIKEMEVGGVYFVNTLTEARRLCRDKFRRMGEEMFIIGGKQIYETYWCQCDRIYHTTIKGTYHGNVKLDKWYWDDDSMWDKSTFFQYENYDLHILDRQ